jgi:hypothetical protein
LVLAIPLVIAEPSNWSPARGRRRAFPHGLLFLICAYVVSLVVTERLFVILKPALDAVVRKVVAVVYCAATARASLVALWTLAGKFLFGR